MEIEVKIDASCSEPKIIILTDKITEDVQEIIRCLSDNPPYIIAGFQNDTLHVIEQADIYRAYSGGGKVFAVTGDGEYTLRLRLYELEERLDKKLFIRISNSEIINLKKVKSFDLSLTGTICIKMTDGSVTYSSRRYISKIKRFLGI